MQYTFLKWSIILSIGMLKVNGNVWRCSNKVFLLSISFFMMSSQFATSCHLKGQADLKMEYMNRSQTHATALSNTFDYSNIPSLYNLDDPKPQENSLREKKSISKLEKLHVGNAMQNKLKQLMTNITETLNDMDWNVLDSIDNSGGEVFKVNGNKKYKKYKSKIENKRNENDNAWDIILDSFIKQMYDVNPAVFEKLRSRINEKFSIKRQVRLAENPNEFNVDHLQNLVTDVPKDQKLGLPRKSIIKTVVLKENIPDYKENEDYTGDNPTKSYHDEKSDLLDNTKTNHVEDKLKTTSTTPSSTFENFYDYGDYYKDNDLDDVNEIAEYEINKIDLEFSTEDSDEFFATKNKVSNYRNTMKFCRTPKSKKPKRRKGVRINKMC